MAITFCPAAVAWGDIATWLSGGATLAAVGVALYTSREGHRLARSLQADAKREAVERDAATAHRLALVIDHELFMVGGQLAALLGHVDSDYIEREPLAVIRMFEANLPKAGMPLSTRFVDQFGVFGSAPAAELMIALSQFNVLCDRPAPVRVELAPLHVQRLGARSTVSGVTKTKAAFEAARQALGPWMQRHHPVSPSFVDVAREVQAEIDAGRG